MRYAYIGTYPPRECGIGTFTNNLYRYMVNPNHAQSNGQEGFIVAMNDNNMEYDYPKEVKLTIRQEHQRDYIQAANAINYSGADACILEHEFGIFGGLNGVYILALLHKLEIPLIVTFHTVLKTPSYDQRAITSEIAKMAGRIVVMSKRAIQFLTRVYDIPSEKVELIEHGVPDLACDQAASKTELNLEDRRVLMTFGLLSRNKGIETVIRALPAVTEKYPDVLYMVLGKTHPSVIRHSGEEYRNFLRRLIKNLKLEDNVFFLNEFIGQQDLFRYLSAADIYITPYLNEAQITSGTLSYAIGAGTAVLSTPYWHAQELLADNRGMLFDFNNSGQLGEMILELLDDQEKLSQLRQNAFNYGKKITWPKTGGQYVDLASRIVKEPPVVSVRKDTSLDPMVLPPFSLTHIRRLTDDTGIIQHAKFGIPNLKEGYCLDDNARALLLALMAHRQKKDPLALEMLPIYLSYIHYMQNEDGTFRNFLSFKREYLDELGSEDSYGRAVWSLGYLLGNAPNDAYYQMGKLVFFDVLPYSSRLESIRGIANTIIGISYYLRSNRDDESITELLRKLTYRIVNDYDSDAGQGWDWFEPVLTYDNGILPLSLFHACEILNDEHVKNVALESMEFLTRQSMKEDCLSLIGNENWYRKDGERSMFAQQPVDALAMVLMYYQAYYITREKKYIDLMFTSFMWFLGENDLRMNLYDFETRGCCDGIERYGVNRNQGAESSLAYLIAHLRILRAHELMHKTL